jgi:hypothetical protein
MNAVPFHDGDNEDQFVGVTPEQMDSIVDKINGTARKLGLYLQYAELVPTELLEPMGFGDGSRPIGDQRPLLVQAQLAIGDLAFVPERVDSESKRTNEEFLKLQSGFLKDEVDDIKRLYSTDDGDASS